MRRGRSKSVGPVIEEAKDSKWKRLFRRRRSQGGNENVEMSNSNMSNMSSSSSGNVKKERQQESAVQQRQQSRRRRATSSTPGEQHQRQSHSRSVSRSTSESTDRIRQQRENPISSRSQEAELDSIIQSAITQDTNTNTNTNYQNEQSLYDATKNTHHNDMPAAPADSTTPSQTPTADIVSRVNQQPHISV